MKKSSETEKTHTFFLKIGEGMMQKWSLRSVTWSVWENSIEREMGRQWTVTKSSRENWKGLKTKPIFATHAFFTTGVSRQQVAKTSRQNTQRQNCEKNFLSVFRDWKVYPRGGRKLSHENLYVPLATGPFTREQIVKINTRPRGYSMRLGWPATESPKQGNTIFEIFQFL